MEINIVIFLELIGTVAFAVSGAKVAIQEKMDLLGICILGVTTAVGGGIIRDIILGITPPAAFQQPIYITVALIISFLTFLLDDKKIFNINNRFYSFIDALGLAVFTIVGALAGVSSGNMFLIIFVGTTTGVGGGVMRDVFASRNPIIFQKNVYATASLIGVIAFTLIQKYNQNLAAILGGTIIFFLRALALKFNWELPKAK
ncbi:trimeric intracellular cation channel family protein [Seminibacterium arietis]|uniref:Trimeric intracellular cation channel family protein n=1 Tax=Seminibacterium arietis TaxID=1173502 RepID=A0ABW3I8H5_9PAST